MRKHTFLVSVIFLACTFLKAQTWNSPVNVTDPTSGLAGGYISLKIANGNPAISYYDATSRSLKYVRANDILGTSWATPVTVDDNISGTLGWYASLQIVNGNPAISYYDAGNQGLKYVRALDAMGNVWAIPAFVDISGDVGRYNSLQVVNGTPAISYYDQTNFNLKYIKAVDASGVLWAAPIAVDIAGVVGSHTSLQVVNGNPAISYFYFTAGQLRYIRANDASGSSWASPVSLEIGTGTVGWFTSLQVVNGNPAISYFDANRADLKYIRANDASGSSWASPVSVDTLGDVGRLNTLRVVNGNPAISYYDLTNKDLKYVKAVNASGTLWSSPVSLDTIGDKGSSASMLVVNGNPAISYMDNTSGVVRFISSSDFGLGTVLLCPFGVATISSSITGSIYQWQVNTGTGFADINDNTNYIGTNTNNLQLNNIPSSWYGYQYRCVVDGSNSNVDSILFLNNWNGAVNTAWENPANWSCGSVPDVYTDVVINSGTVTVNANGTCRTLTVMPGANFTINPGFNLTIMH